MTTAELVKRLDGKRTPKGWSCKCPAHDDRTASLSITEADDGKTLIYCHAGCTAESVVSAMGLKMSDLMPSKENKPTARRIVAEYDYTDRDVNLLFQVVRFEPKDFRQRCPDGRGGWNWSLKGIRRVLYRLRAVVDAVAAGRTIYICEGEKDVAALESLGEVATCNAGGAGKWEPQYTDTLTGADIVIITDKDKPGRAHGELVARSLYGRAASVKIVELPDRAGRTVKDAADWTAAGGTVQELADLVDSTPMWTPAIVEQRAEPESGNVATGLQAQFFQIGQTKGTTAAEKYQAMAAAVVDFLHERGKFYFHADHRDHETAMYFDAARKLLLRISSDEFQSWLASTIGINRSDRAFNFIRARIDDESLTGKTTGLIPENFWASRPGAIYISNGDGRAVKISADAVQEIDNGTDGVLFPRGRTLSPWLMVDPIDPFEACRVFREMAAAAPHGLDLFRLWVLSLPTNQRCKPPLSLTGGIGSGKTKAAAAVFEFFGLPPRISAIQDNGESDFWTALDAGGLTCFDNADTRVKWLADALAAAATDGSHEKRRLYSNSELVQQRARAWSIITSANPTFASDAGLADRLLVVRLDRRNTDTAESALSDEITANRNAGLSWLAWVLAYALADREPVPANLNRRHPDFAAFAVKLGRAIGREAETLAALRAAEADKSRFNLENDELGAGLLAMMAERETFTGTAAELLEALQGVDAAFSSEYWTARRLGKRLQKLWPHAESQFKAKADRGHGNIVVYRFEAAKG